MAEQAPRLLVVGPSWVGDMVMAQSLFIMLKRRYPGATVGVVAPPWSEPILERMAEVDAVHPLAVGHGEFGWKARRALARQLRGRYDRAIVLPRSWKAALVPFLARIPERVGFLGEQRYGLLTERRALDKTVLDQTVKRFVALGLPEAETASGAFALPEPRLEVDRASQTRLGEQHGLGKRPAIAMMPGAEYGPAKQWPLRYFHALAARLSEDGYAVRVIGGPKDHPAGEAIVEGLAHARNLCGETSLADAVDLLAGSEQAVTNDSGLMHVAAAVGTRVQAIYGSSSPAYTPPLTANAQIHYLALDCSPCFKRVCPLGHTNCLNHLYPEPLYHAVTRRIATDG
ncbi:lipopolysaccharide heptosyltransferase II [Halomonas cibimaris]|uniref:lipopolysaccharide heptosyltransferase II n=1 Tax=Halomonas cibimaris TaxID=657012 RepID=A0ABP7LB89_9GAMM